MIKYDIQDDYLIPIARSHLLELFDGIQIDESHDISHADSVLANMKMALYY